MKTQDIAQWVRDAAAGDRSAFEQLVIQHAAIVTGVAYSQCGDFTLSEDIAQESFIEAWKNLATINEPEKFPGWICTIVRRRAVDAMRNTKSIRTDGSINSMALEVHDQKQLTPEASMSLKEEREWVWSMLSRLPEAYREPMILYYRCEESTRDVAIALGETEANIRQRLKRGREMLRAEMAESVGRTIAATAPKAAFAAMVTAAIPSSTYAAGAAITTATAAKSSGATGAAAISAVGGAMIGSLIGIAGGAFGTWMSWKNCEYESQQKFVVRQALQYVIGFALFGILLAILVSARQQGGIESVTVYGGLFAGLMIVSQLCNLAWIWRGIRGYKQIGNEAIRRGEPMRQPMKHQREAIRQQTQVTNSDGSVTYEAFRWNAGAWFGSCFGSMAWMLPICAIAFWFGSIWLAIMTCLNMVIAVFLTIMAWRFREHLAAYQAVQFSIAALSIMTIVVLAGIQFLANEQTQAFIKWTPWAWCIIILFPVISLQTWTIRRSFQRKMLEFRDSQVWENYTEQRDSSTINQKTTIR